MPEDSSYNAWTSSIRPQPLTRTEHTSEVVGFEPRRRAKKGAEKVSSVSKVSQGKKQTAPLLTLPLLLSSAVSVRRFSTTLVLV